MIGTTLSHYRITEKLGQGRMGEVYRAEDTNLSRQVAIKVLPDEFAHDAERLARFEREAKLLASLNHPNPASIRGLEQADGKPFLVLELVEGQMPADRQLVSACSRYLRWRWALPVAPLLLVLAMTLALPVAALPQSTSATEPLGKEAVLAVLRFFDYDTDIPLDGKILAKSESTGYRRETIVLTGGQGDRVPGILAIPRTGAPPYPVVLELHAGASSKEGWWSDDSFERGAKLTGQLLAAGIAVLALDAQYHGERSARNDYLSVWEMYFEKKWFARYRDMLVESTKDYRRALDYLATRPEIAVNRTGVIGHSTGGLMAVYLSAVEPRIRATVACVPALSEPWLYPLSPINVSPGIRHKAILVMAGRSDPMISVQATQRFFDAIDGSPKDLAFFESGHQLPLEYGDRALAWFTRHLK